MQNASGCAPVLKEDYRKRYGFRDNLEYKYIARKGLSESVIRKISGIKHEPAWMLEKRLAGYRHFVDTPVPKWGGDLSGIDYNDIYYYLKPADKESSTWDSVPEEIKKTFDKLGIPEAERRFFAGSEAQYDSEVVYSHVKKELESQGVIFMSTDDAVREHPDIVKRYFGTVVPHTDNKYAALNTATWSGGSFVYVPKNVKVKMPLQAYFRINAEKAGQFERTLIVADEGSDVTFAEGCTAPIYLSASLHAAVVEIIAKKGAHVKYVTVQNWSKNVYNLVTQRAFAYENASVEWTDCNIGSRLNEKYPSVYLKERGARGSVLSVAVAGEGQTQDSGGKIYHLAPDTTSQIVSKSVSSGNGVTTYRGLLHVDKKATNVKASVRCNALLLDETSKTNTFPYMEVLSDDATIAHEASAGKIGEEQLFYLMSRGLSEDEAVTTVVLGFLEPLAKALPLEYSLELKRLIKLDISRKSVG
jgi:Fe-S cluster assembly protein SufB